MFVSVKGDLIERGEVFNLKELVEKSLQRCGVGAVIVEKGTKVGKDAGQIGTFLDEGADFVGVEREDICSEGLSAVKKLRLTGVFLGVEEETTVFVTLVSKLVASVRKGERAGLAVLRNVSNLEVIVDFLRLPLFAGDGDGIARLTVEIDPNQAKTDERGNDNHNQQKFTEERTQFGPSVARRGAVMNVTNLLDGSFSGSHWNYYSISWTRPRV